MTPSAREDATGVERVGVQVPRAIPALDLVGHPDICSLRSAICRKRVELASIDIIVVEIQGAECVATRRHHYDARGKLRRGRFQEKIFQALEEGKVGNVIDSEMHFEAVQGFCLWMEGDA